MAFRPAENLSQYLLQEIFVQTARLNPDYPIMFTLDAEGAASGGDIPLRCITHRQFLSDVTKAALSLQSQSRIPRRRLGTPARNVGILGRNSYCYAVNWIACLFNNWTPVMISAKNSREAVAHILTVSNSSHLLVDGTSKPFAESLDGIVDIPKVFMDSVSPSSSFSSLPKEGEEEEEEEEEEFTFGFEEATEEEREFEKNLAAFYMHTSGSTGHPKLVSQTHKVVIERMEFNRIDTADPLYRRILYPQAPLYHVLGAHRIILFGLSSGTVSLLESANKPFRGDSALFAINKFKSFLSQPFPISSSPDSKKVTLEAIGLKPGIILYTVPSILVDIAAAGKESVGELARGTRAVVFAGAGLPDEVGEVLVESGVDLVCGFGMTEVGPVAGTVLSDTPRRNGEWKYTPLNEGYTYHWIPTADPDRNKMVMVPGAVTPAVINHQDPIGFDTNDIWIKHPTKEGLYRHGGRADDITVLSNGEKTNNKQLETILRTRNTSIAHVVVFGAGRPQNGLLISPSSPTRDLSTFILSIWPAIEHMNKIIPAHSRVVRELVIVEDPNLPFALTDKGTVKEEMTRGMYKERIERAYEDAVGGRLVDVEMPEEVTSGAVVGEWLGKTLKAYLPESEIGGDEDVFEHGMDSLLAVRLQASITNLIKKENPQYIVPKNIVYDYPTIDSLAEFVYLAVYPNHGGPSTTAKSTAKSSLTQRMSSMLTRYSMGLSAPPVKSTDSDCIVITGTTGNLGTFLLDQLLRKPNVRRVYCLNRRLGDCTLLRQLGAFRERGLDERGFVNAVSEGRVRMVDADLSVEGLGLSEGDYAEVSREATHIIHAAWQLNFKLRLEAFEKTHIAGVRHLVDLALASPHKVPPHFVFLSTIASVAGSKDEGGAPEGPAENDSQANFGYGQAKLIGERLSEMASKTGGLNATVVRIGQLSGSSGNGTWNPNEYNPILFRSCFGLGMVPVDLPAVRWIPTDIAASILLKMTFLPRIQNPGTVYYHIENPTPTKWESIAKVISSHRGLNLPLVPLKLWLEEVKSRGIEDSDAVPATRLLEFFENMDNDPPLLNSRNALEVAPEIDYGELSSTLITKYLAGQEVRA